MTKIRESLSVESFIIRKYFENEIRNHRSESNIKIILIILSYFVMFFSHTLNAYTSFSVQETPTNKIFWVGAAKSNITPRIGSSLNGHMRDRVAQNIHDELFVRCIVADDGKTRLAIAVADLCMVSREVLDQAKKIANQQTQIPTENMLISASHTHSAGTACSIFQSEPDNDYLTFLGKRIADAVIRASYNLQPARIGWGVGEVTSQVFNRRWLMKEGTPLNNPFGGHDKVDTNPGFNNPSSVEPAGPVDPDVSVVSFQSITGEHLALLANYSLHYVGGTGIGDVSSDYFGMFADRIQQMLIGDTENSSFVGIMSNGTSGDINNVNYGLESPINLPPYAQMRKVADTIANEVHKVVQNITYQDWVALDVRQKEILIGVRTPSEKEVVRAKEIISKATDSVLRSLEEIYARETLLLKDYPLQVPVVLQSFRLGGLAICAIPCEVFVEIGLEIKESSPFKPTFTVSLANGYNGYLPTVEQHQLGGYETWRARSSYLEVNASDKIRQTLLELLEDSRNSESLDPRLEPIQLFNSKNLDGWYTFIKDRGRNLDPKQVFSVENGLLRISGEEWGVLTTNDEFENYKLEVEYRWGDETFEPRLKNARDSGVLMHSIGEDGATSGSWMHSIECQIIEGGTGDFIVIGDGTKRFSLTSHVAPEKHGRFHVFDPEGDTVTIHGGRLNWYGRDPNWKDVLGFRSKNDKELPPGGWNHLECIADGDAISIYLNGELVNQAVKVSPRKGRIQIESESAELFIRKVTLTPLPLNPNRNN